MVKTMPFFPSPISLESGINHSQSWLVYDCFNHITPILGNLHEDGEDAKNLPYSEAMLTIYCEIVDSSYSSCGVILVREVLPPQPGAWNCLQDPLSNELASSDFDTSKKMVVLVAVCFFQCGSDFFQIL